MLDELLEKGREYCGTEITTKPKSRDQNKTTSNSIPTRRRGKRQAIGGLRDLIKTVRTLTTALRGASKGGGITGLINGITDTFKSLAEGGGPLEAVITQIANIAGFNISSTTDIVPALFMRAFTEVTVSKFTYSKLKAC